MLTQAHALLLAHSAAGSSPSPLRSAVALNAITAVRFSGDVDRLTGRRLPGIPASPPGYSRSQSNPETRTMVMVMMMMMMKRRRMMMKRRRMSCGRGSAVAV
ncbi:hypothetical protein PFLUV_G00219370 [Perca fluviatilis]|uniref:Uncharacterized protein n=1 Tax=Perca fluviatilis TaxID=8168 RepID=A0A6A5EH79_PERFL|nr:hypothetical protein PFLUV_G00219370 [Perca fluviatilis]